MTSHKGQPVAGASHASRLSEMSWNQIEGTGCYLLLESGELVRVPKEGLANGHSPLISITSARDVRVAKLSDNPAEPISVLRAIAADNDYFVNF